MTSLVSWLVLAVTILGWIIPFAMILVVPVNRKPSEATAWLMLLFALPWIGLVAFWLVGSPKLLRSAAMGVRYDDDRYRGIPALVCRHQLRISASLVRGLRLGPRLDVSPAQPLVQALGRDLRHDSLCGHGGIQTRHPAAESGAASGAFPVGLILPGRGPTARCRDRASRALQRQNHARARTGGCARVCRAQRVFA